MRENGIVWFASIELTNASLIHLSCLCEIAGGRGGRLFGKLIGLLVIGAVANGCSSPGIVLGCTSAAVAMGLVTDSMDRGERPCESGESEMESLLLCVQFRPSSPSADKFPELSSLNRLLFSWAPSDAMVNQVC